MRRTGFRSIIVRPRPGGPRFPRPASLPAALPTRLASALRRLRVGLLVLLPALLSASPAFAPDPGAAPRGEAFPGAARLSHVGGIADGGLDARGAPVEVRRPGELAFGGGRLFLASGIGLTVFERDAATGALVRVRHVEGNLSRASLAWDAARGRLLVHDCGEWQAVAVAPGGAVGGLADVGAPGGPGGCGRLLLDAAGGLVHRMGAAGLDAFSIDGDGSLRFEGTAPVPGLKGAAVGGPGRVYAAGGGGLLVIQRDGQTGRFGATPLGVDVDASGLARVPLAHDAATGRLLAVDASGARWLAPGRDGAPVPLPAPDGLPGGLRGCAFAAVRPGSTADVFCEGAVLSSGADGGAHISAMPNGGAPVGTAASPDGRHVYVSTGSGELLTFERVLPSAADDHGDGQATATRVAIPSTTAGYLDAGERDYFRVDLDEAGEFTAETTGSTDTWGFIEYGEHGFVLADSNDDGEGENFRIESGRLEAGTYYVVVEGFSPSTRGRYSLVLSAGGGGPPAAEAPTVSIDAVPAGDEGDAVRLGAALTGGTYDGTPDYAWTVTGGALDNANSTTPEWTRPPVTTNTGHTVRLAVTARGSGTNARAGTSDTARASRSALVRDAAPPLPVADAPTVSINSIAAGDEGTAVGLSATLSGGAYDGTLEYAWTVDGGVLDNPSSATPSWTRPAVGANTSYTVRLTVTARGAGTNARNGTSDTVDASRTALVRDAPPPLPAADAPSVTVNAVPDGDEGTDVQLGATLTGGAYDGALEYAWQADGGRLSDPAADTPTWTRPPVSADTSFTVRLTVTARGTGTNARNGTSDTADASRSALVRDTAAALPAASAPSVSINAIADGDEGTAVRLGAALTGGTYDGSAEYDWDVSGGALDDDTLATPTWTRPAVTSNANVTVSLTVTVRGAGTSARNGTSDTGSASRAAQVLDSPPAATSCVDDAKWKTVADYYDHNATKSPNYGANWYRVLIAYRLEDPERTLPAWEGSTTQPTARYTAAEATSGEAAWSGWTPVRKVLDCLEKAFPTLPAAVAPTVSVDAVAAGDEGTKAGLSAALAGGTYDGAVEYAWKVTGGALDDPASATPEWMRPMVDADGDHTVGLTVTVRGAGANALAGSSAAASTSLDAQVRDVPPQLPAADAPAVSINAIPAGDENTKVGLSAALAGGTYDGSPEYAWKVTGGALDDAASATPEWTRPTVNADGDHTVGLTVTVRGAGTNAQTGSSAAASASLDAQVRDVPAQAPDTAPPPASSCVDDAKWKTVADYYDHNATRSPNYGANWYRVLIAYRLEDPERALPTWAGSTAQPTARYTATEATGGESVWSGWTPVRKALECLEKTFPTLPAAVAPAVSIDAVAAGDEGAKATLGASLTGGTYDGAVEYAWSVTGGALDDATSATPEWTRPTVSVGRDYTVGLTITVHGTGSVALNGSSDTATTSLDTLVRPSVSIDYIPAGDENTDVQLGATQTGLTGTPTYAWSVDGGTLDDPASATPTWTRPLVSDHTRFTVTLDVTVNNAVRSVTLKAWVRDTNRDHSDNPDSATPVSIPDSVAGNISRVGGDPQYFWFSLPEERRIAVFTSSNIWTHGQLIKRQGYEVIANDYGSGQGDFKITRNLPAGEYLVRVRGYVTGKGPYTLALRDSPEGGCVSEDQWSAVAGYYRANATRAPNYGANWYRVLIAYHFELTGWLPEWTGPPPIVRRLRRIGWATRPSAPYTVAEATASENARSSWTPVREVLECIEARRPLADAEAPTVWINAIATGDGSTRVKLGATLTGGPYDGALEYAWQVDGGTLDDATSATPLWTRPLVASDTTFTVSLAVTARGAGTYATSGSSDIATASRAALVRPHPVPINAIPGGDENTTVPLGATLTDGIFNGTPEYTWRVTGGTLDDPNSATPTWTRPEVIQDRHHTVSLRVSGASADDGAATTYNASLAALVRNVGGDHGDWYKLATPVAIPSTTAGHIADYNDLDYFRIHIAQAGTLILSTTGNTDTAAVLADADLAELQRDYDSDDQGNFLITTGSLTPGTYYLVVGTRHFGTEGDYSLSVSGTAQGGVEPAVAPSVYVNEVAEGGEETTLVLGATLMGGAYDGTPEFFWEVTAGTLNDPTLAAPTWTRPVVSADTTDVVDLTVVVRGLGTNAQTGTGATGDGGRRVTREIHSSKPTTAIPVEMPSTKRASHPR